MHLHEKMSKNHTFYGHASKDDEIDILCTLSSKTENAIEGRINSKINLEVPHLQKKMKIKLDFSFPIPSSRTTAWISISETRGKVIPQYLVITMSVTEDGFYRLGISEGISEGRSNEMTIHFVP